MSAEGNEEAGKDSARLQGDLPSVPFHLDPLKVSLYIVDVLEDFEAEHPEELSVKKGDKLAVLFDSVPQGWLEVCDVTAPTRSGLVPASFMREEAVAEDFSAATDAEQSSSEKRLTGEFTASLTGVEDGEEAASSSEDFTKSGRKKKGHFSEIKRGLRGLSMRAKPSSRPNSMSPKSGEKKEVVVGLLMPSNSGDSQPYFQPEPAENVPDDESPRSRKRRKRVMVIAEIIQTERSYVQDLEFICQQYLAPIQEYSILTQRDTNQIFRNVETLGQFHSELLRSLEEKLADKKPSYDTQIAHVFIALGQYLRVYTAYCVGQEQSRNLVLQKIEQVPEFASFCREQVAHPKARGLDILAFLIKPIQRICKYPLLIRQLIDETEKDHPDFVPLSTAFDHLTKVADHVNEQKHMAMSIKRIAELDKNLSGLPGGFQLPLPTRKFIKEGDLIRVAGGSRNNVRVFLFNDVIIAAKTKSKGKYQYRAHMYVDKESTFVEEVAEEIQPFAWQIIKGGMPNIIFSAFSEAEKKEWLEELASLVGGVQTLEGSDLTFTPKVALDQGKKLKEMQQLLGVTDVDADLIGTEELTKTLNMDELSEMSATRQCVVNGMQGFPMEIAQLLTSSNEPALIILSEAYLFEKKKKNLRRFLLFGEHSEHHAFIVVCTIGKSTKFEYRGHMFLTNEATVNDMENTGKGPQHALEVQGPGEGACTKELDANLRQFLISFSSDEDKARWQPALAVRIRKAMSK